MNHIMLDEFWILNAELYIYNTKKTETKSRNILKTLTFQKKTVKTVLY